MSPEELNSVNFNTSSECESLIRFVNFLRNLNCMRRGINAGGALQKVSLALFRNRTARVGEVNAMNTRIEHPDDRCIFQHINSVAVVLFSSSYVYV